MTVFKFSRLFSVGKVSACIAKDLGLIPGLGNALEKEMANHSNTVAWKIPSTEEPSRLHGIARVGHDLATKIVNTLIKTHRFAFLFLI